MLVKYQFSQDCVFAWYVICEIAIVKNAIAIANCDFFEILNCVAVAIAMSGPNTRCAQKIAIALRKLIALKTPALDGGRSKLTFFVLAC